MLRRQCLRQSENALSSIRRRHFSQHAVLNEAATTRQDEASSALKDKFIGIKANILVKTPLIPSTAASRTLSNFHSPYHATVVQKLLDHGAKILPNANMDEFGMGSHSQNSPLLGPVGSVYKRDGEKLSPGGSSGGSAVWVKQELCFAALGSDTGGSVRLPAAWNGVVGFKPSYGRVSRWGVVQYANSMDTVGVIAREVKGCREVFGVVDGFCGKDPSSLGMGIRGRLRGGLEEKEGLRIGIPVEYNVDSLEAAVKEAYVATLNTLQDAGHTLVPVSLPSTRRALSAYYILAPAEASSNLAKYDGIRYGHRTSPPDASPNADPAFPLYAQTRAESFGPEVQRRILLGTYTLSSDAMSNYFLQAQKIRRLVQQDFNHVFSLPNPLLDPSPPSKTNEEKVDFLLTPTAPTRPPKFSDLEKQTPTEIYAGDVFTVPASLAGLPAISIPVPLREKVEEGDIDTVGMQLIGQFGDDMALLDAAEMMEGLVA